MLQRSSKHTFYVQQIFFENSAVYDMVWKNIAEWSRTQITIWCIRIACWISKARKHTHTGCLIFTAFPLQQRMHERPSMLHFTCIVCLVFFYIHGSVHRDFVLIRSNKMQQYAGIYLQQVYSPCFGRPSRPSSGVQKTVIAASGTGHSI